jgi:hypothetical protein
LPEVEILLSTGAFGTADPRDAAALAAAPHSGTGAYGQALRELAGAEHCAYLDMTTPWAEYIRSANVHPHLFYRDVVHANEYGEQILAKIMMAFWTAPERPKAAPLPGRVQHQDGRYVFRNDRYEAVINLRGRLESLKVEGEDFLSPPTVHANAYGAALVGGPDHRTAFDLPDVRLEADMVVARGDGREISYRFLPDGIDFLFDLPEPLHWVLHLNPRGVAYLAKLLAVEECQIQRLIRRELLGCPAPEDGLNRSGSLD